MTRYYLYLAQETTLKNTVFCWEGDLASSLLSKFSFIYFIINLNEILASYYVLR